MSATTELRAVAVACVLASAVAGAAQTLPAPVTDGDYRPVVSEQAALGRLLFWDPILSGNRNIACGTCHHPAFGTSDGVSLSLGEGGLGLGPARAPDPANPPPQRIARNAPALFNLGAREFTTLFADGRVEAGRIPPLGLEPSGGANDAAFASVLAAQTMFPMVSPDEMAGHRSENEISRAVRQGLITGDDGALALITRRVAAIEVYQSLFAAAFPEIAEGRPIRFPDIANALAAFIAEEWRADGSAFDRYLRGEGSLDPAATRGMELFYGEAGCAACHAGAFQTDHRFHAMGAPQIGPGKAEAFEAGSRDTGRMRVTGDPVDAYAFRTPSLRNVTRTGPWGHAGSHSDLAAFLRDHADPVAALDGYDISAAILPAFEPAKPDRAVLDDSAEMEAIRAAVTTRARPLTEDEVAALLAFLESLTDPVALEGRRGIPEVVPSGLGVER